MKRKANFVMTEDMQIAVQTEAKKRGVTESSLLREWLAERLKKEGYVVTSKPRNWGGNRKNQRAKGEE